jgi:hypothetical protein
MSLQRWWSVILSMGLFMALSPLSAQAGPNRTFAPQPNRQAFNAPQPRAFAPQVNRQAFNAPQQRTSANGWNSQPRQWQPPRGNTYGWNGQHRQWNQPHNNANGWNGQHRQGNQHPGHAYGCKILLVLLIIMPAIRDRRILPILPPVRQAIPIIPPSRRVRLIRRPVFAAPMLPGMPLGLKANRLQG